MFFFHYGGGEVLFFLMEHLYTFTFTHPENLFNLILSNIL